MTGGGVFPGLAQHLADLGHGVWSTGAAYTEDDIAIVLGTLPAHPDRCIAIAPYAGGALSQGASNEAEDTESIEIRVRGGADYLQSHEAAAAIYQDVHGQSPITLPNGVRVLNIVARQSGPLWQGTDNANRHEHSLVISVEYLNPTRLRPLPA